MAKKEPDLPQTISINEIQNFQLGSQFRNGNLIYQVREYKGKVETITSNKSKTSDKTFNYLVYKDPNMKSEKWMIDEIQSLSLASAFDYVILESVVKHIVSAPDGFVYIANAVIRTPQILGGFEQVFCANASINNVSYGMRNWLPEIACKRATVRSIVKSMGLLDILFEGDIMVDTKLNVSADGQPEQTQTQVQTKKQTKQSKKTQAQIDEKYKPNQIKSIRTVLLKGSNVEDKVVIKKHLGINKQSFEDCSADELATLIDILNNNG